MTSTLRNQLVVHEESLEPQTKFKFGEEMPNYCDNTLTITGPDRQAVLDKIKGAPWTHEKPEGEPVYFDVEKIIPRPEGLGDKWQDWSYKNWGCRNVYSDGQRHWTEPDADVIYFCTPWDSPFYAINALSAMFPENTFFLYSAGFDLPRYATLFRAGKNSRHFLLPHCNGNTGETATPYEIFIAVLGQTADMEHALAEVESDLKRPVPLRSPDEAHDASYDPALDQEITPLLTPFLVHPVVRANDKVRIAKVVQEMQTMSKEKIYARATELSAAHYSSVVYQL